MIRIAHLNKQFNNSVVTRNLSLTINDGEFLTIIGRSGEGKSVLLKQIIGLIKPDSGEIIVDDLMVTSLAASDRPQIFNKCGYVFQSAALLDSLSIFENIGISLLESGKPIDQVHSIVLDKLHSVGLSESILNKYPSELSGGMKKRVGLARTLTHNPKIILYDEPTTGLDPITTRMIHELIKHIQVSRKTTSIVISHDIEIFKYADRVVMLNEGSIVFDGAAKTIWETDNPYVYQFIRGLQSGPLDSTAER